MQRERQRQSLGASGRSEFRHVVFAGPRGAGRRRAPVDLSPPIATPGRSVSRIPPVGSRLPPGEDEFVRWLFDRAGLHARDYRAETLRRRLPACLRALHAHNTAEARRAIEQSPTLLHLAIGAMVIGVTSFFRDPAVFDALAWSVIPALFGARRAGGPREAPDAGPVRIWSAGCSEGDELYSVAILLAEMNLLNGQAYLLGTDCRVEAIRRAKKGCFDAGPIRHVPAEWRERYFRPAGSSAAPDGPQQWEVIPSIHAAMQWRTADVTQLREPGQWDLILCRNMAMYLRAEASGRLWEKLEASLRPGGFLVLGKAERPVGAQWLSPVGPCIYRRDRG